MFPVNSRCGCVLTVAGLLCSVWMLGGCGSGSMTTTPPTTPPPVLVPGISYSASSLNFGTIASGATSSTQDLIVTSSGTGPLSITSIAATGDYSFTYGNCPTSPSTIAVGVTCKLTLQFTPFGPGTRVGAVVLGTNVTGTAPMVGLTGVGGTTTDTVSASSLSFGSLTVGSTSAVQTVTISATGTTPLILSSIAVSSDFGRPSTSCTATLAVGSSCQVSVTFMPTAATARTGTLTIASNGTVSVQTIALSGTGTVPPPVSGLPLMVKAMAGLVPIAGASVQLYAAGTAGVRMGSTGLLAKRVLTDATGSATVSGFTCPTAATPVYLVASGGTVGAATSANANSLLMTAVGPCGTIVSGANYVVSESTSVAAMYALQQFYATGGVVGASTTNLTGLTNAFGTAAQMIDPATGALPASFPATATAYTARVNSVANLVNTCLVDFTQCGALYSATSVSGVQATNTLDALFNLARFPASNIVAIYAQSQRSTAYMPALAAPPTDWTMFLTYSSAGLNSPSGIALDSTGSVWVSNYFYVASKFTPQGVPVFANGLNGVGLNNSYGLAIDLNDNAWIPNEQPYTNYGIGSVTVLTPTGGFTSGGGGFQQGGLNFPLSVAIDPNGTTWVVDYGNSHVTLLNSLGTPLSGVSGYTTPLFAFPVAVAVDGNHFGWIANQSGTSVTKVAPDGSSFVNYECCNGASGLAIDQGNNVWAANFYGDSVSLISNAGTVVGNASYTGNGGITRPQGIAVDGAGNIWVANYRQSYLTELAGVGSTAAVGSSLTPKTGYGADARLLDAYALAIDASGNIWVSNLGSNTITKFLGLAAPIKTPLSALPKAP